MERDYHPSLFLHPIESVTLLDYSRKTQMSHSCRCDPANIHSSFYMFVSISKDVLYPVRSAAQSLCNQQSEIRVLVLLTYQLGG